MSQTRAWAIHPATERIPSLAAELFPPLHVSPGIAGLPFAGRLLGAVPVKDLGLTLPPAARSFPRLRSRWPRLKRRPRRPACLDPASELRCPRSPQPLDLWDLEVLRFAPSAEQTAKPASFDFLGSLQCRFCKQKRNLPRSLASSRVRFRVAEIELWKTSYSALRFRSAPVRPPVCAEAILGSRFRRLAVANSSRLSPRQLPCPAGCKQPAKRRRTWACIAPAENPVRLSRRLSLRRSEPPDFAISSVTTASPKRSIVTALSQPGLLFRRPARCVWNINARDAGTLPQHVFDCNANLTSACDEPVRFGDLVWRAVENAEEIKFGCVPAMLDACVRSLMAAAAAFAL